MAAQFDRNWKFVLDKALYDSVNADMSDEESGFQNFGKKLDKKQIKI